MKKLKGTIEISEKEFTTKDGEVIKYVASEVIIDGEVFNLQPKKEDKRLFNHLLKANGFISEEKDIPLPEDNEDDEL